MAEGFAGVDVGEVNFDRGQGNRSECVAQGVAVVGEGAGVDEDATGPLTRLVDGVNQLAFVVGLQETQLDALFLSGFLQALVNVVQGVMTVDIRLTFAEQVEVRAV